MYFDHVNKVFTYEKHDGFVEYRAAEAFRILAKVKQGYVLDANEDGSVKLLGPYPKTEAQIAAEKREAYEKRTERLIRKTYTAAQEFAILRQRDEKPEEYAEYYAYCEQCKTTARAEIYGGETQ